MAYPIGTQVRYRAKFKNADGVLTDPTTISFRIRCVARDNVVAEITKVYALHAYVIDDEEIVRDDVGTYTVRHTLTWAGVWVARWEGIGALVAASQDVVVVADRTKLDE